MADLVRHKNQKKHDKSRSGDASGRKPDDHSGRKSTGHTSRSSRRSTSGYSAKRASGHSTKKPGDQSVHLGKKASVHSDKRPTGHTEKKSSGNSDKLSDHSHRRPSGPQSQSAEQTNARQSEGNVKSRDAEISTSQPKTCHELRVNNHKLPLCHISLSTAGPIAGKNRSVQISDVPLPTRFTESGVIRYEHVFGFLSNVRKGSTHRCFFLVKVSPRSAADLKAFTIVAQ
eukprot:554741_1